MERMNTTNAPPATSAAPTYRTDDLPFAAYLHASRKLRFVECELNGTSRVAFVFADPGNAGDQLHLDFEAGAECSAAALYDSIRRLRRVMDGTRTKTSTQGATHNEHPSRRS
jgi:hypothetical protein